ncbi:hypothetical protein [Thomasclavelia sp.]|uniref:hypothetical protein n=1 Tax=Thomasclavelia sp. TaxID=3025757 RepID=UPI0025E59F0E|nr:hypothetical protein [Thomasclavelia sp.]
MENGFVLKVDYKNETKILNILNSDLFNKCLKRSFILQKEQLKNYGDGWKIYVIDILKGYIFIDIIDLELFKRTLSKCKEIFKLNNQNKIRLVKLKKRDLMFLDEFNLPVIKNSTGDIKDGKIVVNKGPLMKKEKMIRKVDRHKRLAFLNYQFSFENYDICFGLEIKNKEV